MSGLPSRKGFSPVAALMRAMVLGLVLLIFAAPSAAAEEFSSSIVRGGRLYDNWYRELGEPAPTEAHPAYPSDMTAAGDPASNWRCKECHGWDYLGRIGAYSEGKHFTGIKGIEGMAGADAARIIAILKDTTHRYGGLMGESDLQDLANFVSKGQVDMDVFIDRASGSAKGDGPGNAPYYKTICANCHGRDGLKIRTMPPLREVARDNPWEALHKILNGHPGENMPALRVFEDEVLAGILAFVQALPPEDLLSSIVRGGRLYDNWYLELKVPPPTRSHPAYPADRSLADEPKSNWRCKECHGWDYLGRDGAYAQGKHYTGIKGIRGMGGVPTDKIIAVLKDATHRHPDLMEHKDLRDLSNFVGKGQINMDRFIDRATGLAKGDESGHVDYYETICANCHGAQGLKVKTMRPLGKVARENPWKALHMIMNGHPDEKMPALGSRDIQVLVDILAYIQTLPSERWRRGREPPD